MYIHLHVGMCPSSIVHSLITMPVEELLKYLRSTGQSKKVRKARHTHAYTHVNTHTHTHTRSHLFSLTIGVPSTEGGISCHRPAG